MPHRVVFRFRAAFRFPVAFVDVRSATRLAAGCALAAGLTAGCGGDTSGSPAAGSAEPVVRDSAGIAIVHSAGGKWTEEQAWRLEPELQLGELDGPLAFGQISFVGPGANGEVFVVDGQSATVHVFAADGAHLRAFGGEGDGPGEFQRPRYVRAVGGGRVAVAQTFPPLLHWVTAEGEFLETWRIRDSRNDEGTRTAPTFALWTLTDDGTAVAQVSRFPGPAEEDRRAATALIRFAEDPAASPGDTLVTWDSEQRLMGPNEPLPVLEPRHTWDVGPGGSVAVAPGDPYEIRLIGPDGGLRRILRRTVDPVPVTEGIRRRTREDWKSSMSEGGAPEALVDSWVERMVFPDHVPAVQQVWLAEPDGHVWVGVHEAAGFSSQERPSAWDVFDTEGAYLGRVPVPEGFEPHVITGTHVYGVWTDELEVPFARRYRIRRPGRES